MFMKQIDISTKMGTGRIKIGQRLVIIMPDVGESPSPAIGRKIAQALIIMLHFCLYQLIRNIYSRVLKDRSDRTKTEPLPDKLLYIYLNNLCRIQSSGSFPFCQ